MAKKQPKQREPITEVPEASIQAQVKTESIHALDHDIRTKFTEKCKVAGADESLARACGSTAVRHHQENRLLYNKVLGGKF